ncbi:50S ribosomal protein L25 [Candidatus Desantisbacteria bacterium]|nr:50S ribosomal protein L25 [Candidatus Desantisbacteria bacterium]
MHQVELNATLREKKGKEANKKLKANGSVPAILYGRERDNISLTINAKELARVITAGGNAIVSMTLTDNTQETVVLKDWQLHPYNGTILHADFYRISLEDSIETKVPIEVVGVASGQKTGGVLDILLREIEVRALPLQIPDKFEINVSPLETGDIIHVKDIQMGEGIEILSDPEQVVITLTVPVVEVVEQGPSEPEIVKKKKGGKEK